MLNEIIIGKIRCVIQIVITYKFAKQMKKDNLP